MDTSDVRRRVKRVIDESRRAAVARRARADAASAAYDTFLERVAAPLFKQVSAALKAEGYAFQVFTPGGGVRLSSERAPQDFIEILLDVGGDEPVVLGRVSRGRGSRVLTADRPVKPGTGAADLTEHDLLHFLLDELPPFVER